MNTNPKTKFNFILVFLVILFTGIAISLYFLHNIAGKVRESKIKVAAWLVENKIPDKHNEFQKSINNKK